MRARIDIAPRVRVRTVGRSVVAIVVVAAAFVAAAAHANGPVPASEAADAPALATSVDEWTRLSQDNPLPPKIDPATGQPHENWCGSEPPAHNWEMENDLALDPTNPDHLVTTWKQDFDDAIVVGYSFDGGKTWGQALPRTSRCSWWLTGRKPAPAYGGNNFEVTNSANDETVSIGPAIGGGSVAYLSSVTMAPQFAMSAALVNRSLDGGRTWSDPVVLDSAVGGAAGESIDWSQVWTDPTLPGQAWALWMVADFRLNTSVLWSAYSEDAGESWSAPVRVTPSANLTTNFVGAFTGQFVRAANGDLLVTYVEVTAPTILELNQGSAKFMVARSTDDGRTWRHPTEAVLASPRGAVIPRVAKAPNGDLYLAWMKPTGTEFAPTVVRSTDNGFSWSAPKPVGDPAPATVTIFSGAPAATNIAVAGDGTIGVAFYDSRHDDPATPALETDYWLRTSRDGGVTWNETHLAGPFDLESAPDEAGHSRESAAASCDPGAAIDLDCHEYGHGVLGDYNGILGTPRGFLVNAVLAHSLRGANFKHPHPRETAYNPTDLFFTRLTW